MLQIGVSSKDGKVDGLSSAKPFNRHIENVTCLSEFFFGYEFVWFMR